MKKLVLGSAIAASLFSIAGAKADLSIYDIGRDKSASAAVHGSAPIGEREACNDRWGSLDVLACGTQANAAQRPAWRGLN